MSVQGTRTHGGRGTLTGLFRYSIRCPKRVTVISLLITAAIAPGAARLKIRTDGHALVPADAPEVLFDESIREEFDIEDPIVVVIRTDHPNGIFNISTLRLIDGLTRDFKELDGVKNSDVFSLSTERNNRVYPGTLTFRTFLDPMPATQRELDRLRDDLLGVQLYTGTLVSYDELGTSILIGTPPGADRSTFYREIQDIVAAQGAISDKISVIGAPVAEALLGTHILEDLGVPSMLLGATVGRAEQDIEWRLPRTLDELRLLIAGNIGLVPIAIAVMMVVFVISFRSVTAAVLPMTEVGACLIVVFGLMGWFDVPVYLTIAVLPVILTAIGVADEIHIFARYVQELRDRPGADHIAAVTATMEEMWIPVVKTSVTTAVGFLSFALSPIGPVRAFGLFTAAGIVFCMLWSLTVIPALLVLIPPKWFVARAHRNAGTPGEAGPPWFGRFAVAVVRYRFVVLALAALIVAIGPIGLRRVVVQDSWIDGFAPSSPFHKATSMFNEQFLGTHILLVCVDTGEMRLSGELDLTINNRPPLKFPADLVADPETLVGLHVRLRPIGRAPVATQGPRRSPRAREFKDWIATASIVDDRLQVTTNRTFGLLKSYLRLGPRERVSYEITSKRLCSPDVLHRIAELEDFIESRRDCTVGGVMGTADYIETTNYLVRARKEEYRRIPDTPRQVDRMWAHLKRVRGEEGLREVVDEKRSRGLITVFLKDANFQDTARLMDAIREYERANLAPHGIALDFAGDVAVSQTLIGAIVSTQVRSLIVSLIGILLVTTVLVRSLHWGLYCVLPCAVAVLINFAVMGFTGMPLGVATSMFAGMTLGIGVDFAIHLLERFRLARSRGLEPAEAVSDAVTAVGPAIVIDGLGVALGFGVMTLSQVPANARLGALVVLSIIGCLAATLLLLPALVRLWTPRAPSATVARADRESRP